MKKIAVLALVLGVFMSAPSVSWAQEDWEGGGQAQGQQGFGARGGQQQGGPGGKGNMMMAMMNKPTMVATSDGGVVVLHGPKLAKYDQNLELVKEVELKHPGPKGGGQQQKPAPPPAEEETDDLANF